MRVIFQIGDEIALRPTLRTYDSEPASRLKIPRTLPLSRCFVHNNAGGTDDGDNSPARARGRPQLFEAKGLVSLHTTLASQIGRIAGALLVNQSITGNPPVLSAMVRRYGLYSTGKWIYMSGGPTCSANWISMPPTSSPSMYPSTSIVGTEPACSWIASMS